VEACPVPQGGAYDVARCHDFDAASRGTTSVDAKKLLSGDAAVPRVAWSRPAAAGEPGAGGRVPGPLGRAVGVLSQDGARGAAVFLLARRQSTRGRRRDSVAARPQVAAQWPARSRGVAHARRAPRPALPGGGLRAGGGGAAYLGGLRAARRGRADRARRVGPQARLRGAGRA